MTSETPVTETPNPAAAGETKTMDNPWWGRIQASTQRRDALLTIWKESVAFRVMAPFEESEVKAVSDTSVVTAAARMNSNDTAVAEDWSRTKQKTAQLMFKVPRIIAKALNPVAEPAAPIMTAAINQKLGLTGVRAAFMMDECLADVINAAGLAISHVSYETYTEKKSVPAINVSHLAPEQLEVMMAQGLIPTTDVDQIIARRYKMSRISPADFLWPSEFRGSDWDEAPWLGYETAMATVMVKTKWADKIPADWKGGGAKPETLADDVIPSEIREAVSNDYTKVTVIYYKACHYMEGKHPDCIHTCIFVDGIDDPVFDGPLPWQKWVPEDQTGPGRYIGVTKFPIRVGTLCYVSDLAVPPSDSEAGRSQIIEMMKSRRQMLRQRDSSIPVRWFDENRVDEEIQEQLKAGTWQDWIPMNGPGDRAIGEVARAQFPRENFEFLRAINGDLDRAWSLSNNQLASMLTGRRSAAEVNTVQGASEIRLEYEKNKIHQFFLGNVEVLAGLLQMFQTPVEYVELVGSDGTARLAEWNKLNISGPMSFDLVPDSSEHLDIETRIARLLKVYNLMANSQSTNRPYLEKEIMELMGIDPARGTVPPQEPKPEPPAVSYRFSGEDLLTNAIALAIMNRAGHALKPEEIAEAQRIIASAQTPAPPHVGAPGAQPDGKAPVTPPEANEPILKRSESGERLISEIK